MTNLRYPGAYVATTPDKAALVMAGSGTTVTFAALDAVANQLARALRVLGLDNEDHVTVCMENRAEFSEVAWGAHYAGLHYTFFSTRLSAEEAAHIVDDSGSTVVVLSAATADRLLPELREMVGVKVRFLSVDDDVDGTENLFALAASMSSEPVAGALEGSDMLYSSGTTGRPKGVLRPSTGLPLGTTAIVAKLAEAMLDMSCDSIYLSPAPMYHAAPLRWVQDTIALGATAVVMERFDAEAALATIEQQRITHAQFVPTMFVRMLRLPPEVRARYDLSSLRAVVHAAAPCPPEIKRAMLDWWGPVVHEFYGGTEGSGVTWCTPAEWLAHQGSVGRSILGQVHIVGDDGAEVAAGEEGLVYFGGGPSFTYHNDPAKTAEVYDGRGWSTLGDIGRLDEDGFLYLTDRRANMIITGGVNVYPQEAENVLTAHPDVLDVAVFGVPNDDFGEEVKAVVQLVDGVDPSDDRAATLVSYCRSRLADVKCPRSIEFRADLPRTETGKLMKRLLRDEYWRDRERRI